MVSMRPSLRVLACALAIAGLGAQVAAGAGLATSVPMAGDRRLGSADRPTPPAGGHDVTRPWIMPDAAARTPVAIGKLQPRTAVAPLEPRPAVTVAPRAAAGALKREVFGFADGGALADPNVGYGTWDLSLLSTVAYFSLAVIPSDGSLDQSTTGWKVWQSSTASTFINAAHAAGVRVVLSFDYQATDTTMCTALDHGQTTIDQLRANLLGADGVNIDYEGANGVCPADGVPLRTKLVQFVRAVRAQIPGYLSIDTYASSAEDGGGFFDIPSLAGTVDSIFVMDYGLEPPNGPCATCMGPTSPLAGDPTYVWNVTRSANDYRPWAPQVILGFPYYGVKACVQPDPPANAMITPHTYGADPYVTIKSYPGDPNIANFQESRDALDPNGQEPWASFFSGYTNCWREEYFDDDVSLGRKYDLVDQLDFRGAGMFALDYGGGSPELWNALQTHFAMLPAAPTGVTARTPGSGSAAPRRSSGPASG